MAGLSRFLQRSKTCWTIVAVSACLLIAAYVFTAPPHAAPPHFAQPHFAEPQTAQPHTAQPHTAPNSTAQQSFTLAGVTCNSDALHKLETRLHSFNGRLLSELSAKHNFAPAVPDGENSWQGVLPSVYIYSAYFHRNDSDPVGDIRLVGITSKSNPIFQNTKNFTCKVRTESGTFDGKAEMSLIPEDHGYQFSAAFVRCVISEVPSAARVEVALQYSAYPLVWINVHQYSRNESQEVISVCVRPLFGPFENLVRLVEFLTYYSVLGVKQFSFYVTGDSRKAYHFLRLLGDQHNVRISLHSWNLPLATHLIHSYGQLAFTQDCLYRARQSSKYVTVVDLDEFIVPKRYATLPEALAALEKEHSGKVIGNFNVRNQFFCLEYPPETSLETHPRVPLLTPVYTMRQSETWPHASRSKYIARPNAAAVGGIHFIWKHEGNEEQILVPPDVMAMHHYRRCCGIVRELNKVTRDTDMSRFTKQIVNHDLIRTLETLT